MTQNKVLVDSFVRQGFTNYPAAVDAIEFFEGELWRAIRRAFDEKTDWLTFRRSRGTDGQPIQPKEGRTSGPARWLWSYVEGEKRGEDKTWLTLGVCWNPPKQRSGSVVAYASYTIGNRSISVDDKPGRDARVLLGSLDRNERRPFMVIDEQFDADNDFRLLLDVIDAFIPAVPADGGAT